MFVAVVVVARLGVLLPDEFQSRTANGIEKELTIKPPARACPARVMRNFAIDLIDSNHDILLLIRCATINVWLILL
jgi:hypothetical protein